MPPMGVQFRGKQGQREYATQALGNLVQVSSDSRNEVIHELLSARHRTSDPRKFLHIDRALTAVSVDETNRESDEADLGMAILMFRLQTRD